MGMILELAILTFGQEKSRSEAKHRVTLPTKPPETVDEAVKRLIAVMSLKEKTTVANTAEVDLIDKHISLVHLIRVKFLYPGNEKLLESCRQYSRDKHLDWDQAPTVIIKRLWEVLRKSHKLRIVG